MYSPGSSRWAGSGTEAGSERAGAQARHLDSQSGEGGGREEDLARRVERATHVHPIREVSTHAVRMLRHVFRRTAQSVSS